MAQYVDARTLGAGIAGGIFSLVTLAIILAVAGFIFNGLFAGVDTVKANEDAKHGNDGTAFSIVMIFLLLTAAGYGLYLAVSAIVALGIGVIAIRLSWNRIASDREVKGIALAAGVIMGIASIISALVLSAWLFLPGNTIVSPPIFGAAVLIVAFLIDAAIKMAFCQIGSNIGYRRVAKRKASP